MTDRPILFSGPMIRALLDGRKTQTRRTIKPRKHASLFDGKWSDTAVLDAGNQSWREEECRWRIGDRLWVRESWRAMSQWDKVAPSKIPIQPVRYEADFCLAHSFGKARSSIFMPRWASRLTLTVTHVRVERLQAISESDAIKEGVFWNEGWDGYVTDNDGRNFHFSNPVRSYENLWDSINGDGASDANPWVVVLTFTVERRNIDAQVTA